MASDDIYELREQVKSLLTSLRSINEEKRQLVEEYQSYESKCCELKTEINILNALDMVRFQPQPPLSSSQPSSNSNPTTPAGGGRGGGGSVTGSVTGTEQPINDKEIFTKEFLEANLKLDLTILNQELRQNLPKFEKEIIEKEFLLQRALDELNQQKLRKKNLSLKSEDNMNLEINELLEKRSKIEGEFPFLRIFSLVSLPDSMDRMTRETLDKRRNLAQVLVQKRQQVDI